MVCYMEQAGTDTNMVMSGYQAEGCSQLDDKTDPDMNINLIQQRYLGHYLYTFTITSTFLSSPLTMSSPWRWKRRRQSSHCQGGSEKDTTDRRGGVV